MRRTLKAVVLFGALMSIMFLSEKLGRMYWPLLCVGVFLTISLTDWLFDKRK